MRGAMISLALASVLALSACGDSSAPGESDVAAGAAKLLDDGKIAGMLSAEAKAALDILGQGVRAELAAYKAQYGQLPANLSDLASLQTARAAAVTTIADAMAEQVPFVRRETLEQMAGKFVDRAQQRVLDQMKAAEAAAGESAANR